jgi:hypothetical protein
MKGMTTRNQRPDNSTSANGHIGADDPLGVARDLLRRGIMPLPLIPGEKNPTIRKWQNLTIDDSNVERFFAGAGLNVGGRMGAKSGGLLDIDLDAVEAIRLAPHFLPPTQSRYGRPSKREWHWLYRCDDAELRGQIPLKDDGKKMLCELRIGGGTKGAQSVMPGSRHPEGEVYAWDADGEPARVAFAALKAAASKLAVAAVLLRHWPEESGRHDASLGVGGFLARAGLSPEDIHHMVRAICVVAGGEDWADDDNARTARESAEAFADGREARGFPWVRETFGAGVAKCVAKLLKYREATAVASPASEGEGVTLDDFYAYMPLHNYIYAPSRDHWPAASVNARIPPIPILDEDGEPEVDDEGNEKKLKAGAWIDQNRPVEQVTWAPGLPLVILNRLVSSGGWIERNGVSCFNLYLPPTIALGDAGAAGPWLEHVRKVYPNDADHILKWLAHRRQRPQEKINHALDLGGEPGIGKDTLLEPVKVAVGPWNFAEISPKQVLDTFNPFARSTIMRISEARDLGDISRYEFYDAMKTYTAAPPDMLYVNEKNLRQYYVPNCVGVVMTTNYKDALYITPDDRRNYVAWSELTKEDFTEAYWKELWGWYEAGGYSHVAAYLAALDISSFNAKAPPLKTPAFWAVVDRSRAPEESELADLIDALSCPKALTVKQLTDATTDRSDLTNWLKDRKNRRAIPHRLEKCGYVAVRNDTAADGFWKISGTRHVIYAKSNLSVRDQLAAAQECKKKEESAAQRPRSGETQR